MSKLQTILAPLQKYRTLRGIDGRYYYNIQGVKYPSSLLHHNPLRVGVIREMTAEHITTSEIAKLVGMNRATVKDRLDALEYKYHVYSVSTDTGRVRAYNRDEVMAYLTRHQQESCTEGYETIERLMEQYNLTRYTIDGILKRCPIRRKKTTVMKNGRNFKFVLAHVDDFKKEMERRKK